MWVGEGCLVKLILITPEMSFIQYLGITGSLKSVYCCPILITTGMRLSEASNLSWERFSEDHDGIQGMRCFSLLNTNDETVAVKNKGSMRIIPLHPDLELPPKGTGRLFNYKMNEDGLASHDAGRAS